MLNAAHDYRPQRSCAKVIFLHVSVILSTAGGSAPLHAGVYSPRPKADTPLDQKQTPPWDTVNERPVRILLECILVYYNIAFAFASLIHCEQTFTGSIVATVWRLRGTLDKDLTFELIAKTTLTATEPNKYTVSSSVAIRNLVCKAQLVL